MTIDEIRKEFEAAIGCANFVNSDYITFPLEIKYIRAALETINKFQEENEQLRKERENAR